MTRKVLERENSRLIAVLPFDPVEYRKDFASAAERADFEELLAQDPEPTILGRSRAEESELIPPDVAMNPAARDEGYYRGGTWVVERCEILIAVWNGKPADGHGGTGDTVASALRRGRSVFWIDANDPSKPIQVIRAAGHNELRADGHGDLPKWRTAEVPKTAKELSSDFHQVSAYNRDQACDGRAYEDSRERHGVALRNAAERFGLPPHYIDPVISRVIPQYARADCLANLYKRLHRCAGVALYSLTSLAVTIAVVQHLFLAGREWLIWLEVLSMFMALAVLRVSRTEKWHQKWLCDRQLAERFRAAMFMGILGSDSGDARWGRGESLKCQAVGNDVLPFYRGAEGWIIEAARRARRDITAAIAETPRLDELKVFVTEAWIADQANWNTENAKKKRGTLRRAHRLGMILFGTTLLMAAFHAMTGGESVGGHITSHHHWWSLIVTALTVALPAWGASVHAVTNLREYDRIAARSERMSDVLRSIAQDAREARNLDELRRTCLRAEGIMAMENHEWFMSLSFRDLHLPG